MSVELVSVKWRSVYWRNTSTNDNQWQQMTTNDNKWQQMTTNDNIGSTCSRKNTLQLNPPELPEQGTSFSSSPRNERRTRLEKTRDVGLEGQDMTTRTAHGREWERIWNWADLTGFGTFWDILQVTKLIFVPWHAGCQLNYRAMWPPFQDM